MWEGVSHIDTSPTIEMDVEGVLICFEANSIFCVRGLVINTLGRKRMLGSGTIQLRAHGI
jgi:hypothetical protein